MGRRTVKEYRAPEALNLITADRDGGLLVCPSCGSATIVRHPDRTSAEAAQPGRVTLHCSACHRSASYIDRTGLGFSPEAPRALPH